MLLLQRQGNVALIKYMYNNNTYNIYTMCVCCTFPLARSRCFYFAARTTRLRGLLASSSSSVYIIYIKALIVYTGKRKSPRSQQLNKRRVALTHQSLHSCSIACVCRVTRLRASNATHTHTLIPIFIYTFVSVHIRPRAHLFSGNIHFSSIRITYYYCSRK